MRLAASTGRLASVGSGAVGDKRAKPFIASRDSHEANAVLRHASRLVKIGLGGYCNL